MPRGWILLTTKRKRKHRLAPRFSPQTDFLFTQLPSSGPTKVIRNSCTLETNNRTRTFTSLLLNSHCIKLEFFFSFFFLPPKVAKFDSQIFFLYPFFFLLFLGTRSLQQEKGWEGVSVGTFEGCSFTPSTCTYPAP